MLNRLCSIKKSGFWKAACGVFTLLVLWGIYFPVEATIYKWKDGKGAIHFTSDPSQVPNEFRDGIEVIEESDHGSASSEPSPGEQSIADDQPVDYEIPVIKNGNHFIVNVLMNDSVTAHLLVDTGASMITISPAVAKKLGYHPDDDLPEIPASTAGGTVWSPLINLEKVKIGEAEEENIEAMINSQMGSMDGLLGLSFLNSYNVIMDHENSRMILKSQIKVDGISYGGKSANWWQSIYSSYFERVTLYKAMARQIRSKDREKGIKLEKVVRYYKDRLLDLDIKADDAGVPSELRIPE
ncbi:MAG: TIGR02281 family clan AA aspartic protease [Nitrospinales bacterium]